MKADPQLLRNKPKCHIMELILTTPEALAEIVEQAMRKCQRQQPAADTPDSNHLDLPGAIDFLCQAGFSISSSKIYKLTADGKIPHRKFGKRLVFNRDELAAWAEAQLRSLPDGSETRAAIAQSARKKDKR